MEYNSTWYKIAKIDGRCTCERPKLTADPVRSISVHHCGNCKKPHYLDFDDVGVMMGVINRWTENSGDGSDDASERWYDHNYDGTNHTIKLEKITHVFDDTKGMGDHTVGEGSETDFAIAAQKSLIKAEGL